MPVSTRSQISGGCSDDSNPWGQAGLLRNPHHRLKEKMKALTLLYEQHHIASQKDKIQGPAASEHEVFAAHHSRFEAEKENRAIRSIAFPGTDAKNQEFGANGRIAAYSCPLRPTMARKLSIGKPPTEATLPILPGFACEETKKIADDSEGEPGSRILVFVRLRPMAKKEKTAGSRCCVKIVDRKEVYLTEFASELDYLRLKRLRGRHFRFDAAFPDAATQLEVYTTTTAELVEGVLRGRNGSVFCYGATGAGKTYTMLGSLESPGVMVLAIKVLFKKIRERSFDGNHSVHLSYLEVYNETVRDLLAPGRPLVLREDKQGISAAGLTQYRAYSTEEVMALLQQGNLNRTTEPTRANETSSRSHAILQVFVEYRTAESGNVINRVGKLSLIDLAGSERALATDQRTQRSVEGANINRSLLALSSCINALVEGKKHIPYRNSKLTQLLKDSLGGACNMVMIANISPCHLVFGETQNTLHWADRAKEIRTKAVCVTDVVAAQVPETDQARLVLELHKENSKLRQQLAHQKQKMLEMQVETLAPGSSPAPSIANLPIRSKLKSPILPRPFYNTPDFKKKNEANEKAVTELRCRVRALEAEMDQMRKDHLVQLMKRDETIQGLIMGGKNGVANRAVARAVELKSPVHHFRSPARTTAKKRSFWDSTAADSPSVIALNGRKIRSHSSTDTASAAPSMFLQPGFARRRTEVPRR